MLEPGVIRGQWWHQLNGRVQCDLCPRYCKLKEGQRGFCFIRKNQGGEIVLTSYGRASGFCIDPIEKKPLNHFYPGTSVLSFGTAGCNLGCKFCQNWDISKAREMDRLQDLAMPEAIVEAAVEAGCHSIAYTYNDPVIFAEFAIDTAKVAHERGVKNVAVTAGYITEEARPEFYEHLDAVNVDLKAFTDQFYQKLCFAHLEPVLDTLKWIHDETDVWLEVTTLLIPGQNDSDDEIARLADWFAENLGTETPLHFSAFHPDFKMRDIPPTPPETLSRAREISKKHGIHHVYTGNVHDPKGQSTFCASCDQLLIERDWYQLGKWNLDADGKCNSCGTPLAGRFAAKKGTWGARRLPVHIRT
jgi:pyruvate formate lyase activating enzyme